MNPGSGGPYRLERASHQAGAHEQHERDRELNHDERVARAVVLATRANGAAEAAQRRRNARARVPQLGISPNNTLDNSESTAVNAMARQSSEISFKRGRFAGPTRPRGRKPA